jgi:hypothetical protein
MNQVQAVNAIEGISEVHKQSADVRVRMLLLGLMEEAQRQDLLHTAPVLAKAAADSLPPPSRRATLQADDGGLERRFFLLAKGGAISASRSSSLLGR